MKLIIESKDGEIKITEDATFGFGFTERGENLSASKCPEDNWLRLYTKKGTLVFLEHWGDLDLRVPEKPSSRDEMVEALNKMFKED
jgi:hypothetical protein